MRSIECLLVIIIFYFYLLFKIGKAHCAVVCHGDRLLA